MLGRDPYAPVLSPDTSAALRLLKLAAVSDDVTRMQLADERWDRYLATLSPGERDAASHSAQVFAQILVGRPGRSELTGVVPSA